MKRAESNRDIVRQVNASVEREISIYVSRGTGPRVRVIRARVRKGVLEFRALIPSGGEWFAVAADEAWTVEAC